MDIDPKSFLDVPLNRKGRHACSPPKPGPDWLGVIIRAPRLVKFQRGEVVGNYGAFAAIPICGFYRVEVRWEENPDPLKLVVVDRRTGQALSGPIIELDPSPIVPPPKGTPIDPQKTKGQTSGSYFNPNLADYVALPHTSATYDVHVEFREYKSNVVTIELIESS